MITATIEATYMCIDKPSLVWSHREKEKAGVNLMKETSMQELKK